MNLDYVIKRDGKKVEFKSEKIENAVAMAASAVDQADPKIAAEITAEVLSYLKIFFKNGGTVEVEQIQDLVEKVLIEKGYAEIAKAYIIYREQHSKLRDSKKLFADAVNIMDDYLDRSDWKVNENSNMSYSLQGLNNYIASEVTGQYWLQEIYPKETAELHSSGDLHIHDLGNLSVYCCGWDLEELLRSGFRGVPTKIESSPPKHLKTALGQIVNFFYTLQGESAGAQAFSNFDTYLAPYIAYDGLNYEEVKQAMQEFLFNMNVPTRVGFQCLSEDTKILTDNGWKYYDEVKKGDEIKTFNVNNNVIETKKVKNIFRRYYEGEMYNLKNRIQDQLISPGHRIVRKKFNTKNNYCLNEIDEIYENFKTPPIIPIAANNKNKEIDLLDEEIKLIAWIIAEGSLEIKGNWRRITIYQSKKRSSENDHEIISLLKILELDYSIQEGSKSLGETVTQIRFNAKNSRLLLKYFNNNKNIKAIPNQLLNMSQRQSELFLETYIKGDGHEKCKITTSSSDILESLQTIIVNSGYGFTTGIRMSTGVGNKLLYILRVIRHQDTYIQEINKVDYAGVIWSVNTDNETVIAKRNGKVFITGNTPFTNITMDLEVPNYLKDQAVIIGGQYQEKCYGEFQEEMDMFNRAFAELMMEGDAKGRMFSFPIPTYNITEDFEWENEKLDPVWEMTAKFGIPYFSNFINSDMDPEDARSMCLHPEESIFLKKNEEIKKMTIGKLFEEYRGEKLDENWFFASSNIETLSLNPKTGKLEWAKINKFLKTKGEQLVTITAKDGKTMKVSPEHQVAVYTKKGIEKKKAKELDESNFLIVMQDASSALRSEGDFSEELLWFMGLFVADGNYLYDSRYEEEVLRGIQISFNRQEKFLIEKTKRFIKDYLDYDMKFILDPRYDNSLRGYIYNSEFANIFKHDYKVRKYNGLPDWIWSSSAANISSFIEGFFDGDGYENGKEIHINDKKLAAELNLLIQLVGISTTLRYRKNSQIIRFQHVLGRGAYNNKIIKDSLHNFIPEFLLEQKVVKDELGKNRYQSYGCKMVGLSSVDRWNISNDKIEFLRNADFAVTEIKDIKINDLNYEQTFYDIELEKNHYFVHSDGNITHNCCRLRLDNKELRKRGGGLFGANPMTGSIGVVTLNMPRIGYQAQNKEEFMERVYYLMDQAKESLEIKRRVLETLTEQGLYPYAKFYLRDIKKRFDQYWKNHFNTIGLNGMNEALLNFMGKDISTPEGQQFSEEVMEKMRERLQQYQEETDNMYNLEATPAEGTAYRFARLDREKFGNQIIAANQERVVKEDADPYYTNSTQLPVGLTDDIFTALELQDELQSLYSGGTVLHGFLGEKINSIKATKKLVRRIAENFKLPYYTLTPSFSICPVHGYLPGEHEYCPKCETEAAAEEEIDTEKHKAESEVE